MLSLKSSVFSSKFDDGVVFRGYGAPVIFRGKRAYELARALVGQMERGATRDELLGMVPEPVRPAAQQLISNLEQHDLLRSRAAGDPLAETRLGPRYKNLWNYLADNHREPGRALDAWLGATLYVEGTAAARRYSVRALADCAAQHVVVRTADDDAPAELLEEAAALERIARDAGGVRIERRAAGDAQPPGSPAIYAGGGEPVDAARTALADAWFFGLLAGHLTLGYAAGPLADVLPAWERMMRPAPPEVAGARVSELRVGVAADALAFAVFRAFCGIAGPPDLARPHVVDPAFRLKPLAVAEPPRAATAKPNGVPAPAPAVDAERVAAAEPLFDPVTGLLAAADDDDVRQVPLSISRVRVRAANGEERVVTGWGTTADEARARAVRLGVEAHLRAQPALRDRAAGLAVDWSAEAARANAAADAAGRARRDESAWQPLDAHELHRADVRKMLKLVTLLTGAEPELRAATSANPPSASVRVRAGGAERGLAHAADLESAAYEAIGAACAALQLGEAAAADSATANAAPADSAMANAASADIATAEIAQRCVPVDLGYPAVAGALHAWIADRTAP